MHAHELEARLPATGGVTQVDKGDPVLAGVDDVAEGSTKLDLFHKVEITDEHRVLERETEPLHCAMDPPESNGIADVLRDQIALTGHPFTS